MQFQLSNKINKLSESATIRMNALAVELRNQGHEVINLSLGEPDFDTPDFIKDAAYQALKDGYTKYTPVDGLVELKQAIKTKFERDNNLQFELNQIMVSNGAKQSIYNLASALLNPGDEVILFTPYWVSYIEIVKLCGGVPVCLKAEIEDDFKPTPEALKAAINDKTKFILFSSPCNPTGTVFSEDDLRAYADVIAKHPDVVVISDEIYEYINHSGESFSIGRIDKIKNQVVTVNGFSKGFAMTGWRLGYIGGPAEIIKACKKIQGQVTSGANAFAQKAGSIALLSDLSCIEPMKKAYFERKELAKSLLEQIPNIKCNDPQGAFYIFPDVSAYFGKKFRDQTIKDADHLAELFLKEAFVATVSGSPFGASECIRLSIAASKEDIKTAITRIHDFLAEVQ